MFKKRFVFLKDMSTLIFNNGGLGNGIIIHPILLAVEGLDIRYFHIENEFLRIRWGDLPSLIEFVPSIWRRFGDLDAIVDFIEQNEVTRVLNGRKEDRRSDGDYFRFKELATSRGYEVFDLHADNVDNTRPISIQMETMFRNAFMDLPEVNWGWLGSSKSSNYDLLMYVGSAILGKSLGVDQILRTYHSVREEHPSAKLHLVAGRLPYEQELIEDVRARIQGDEYICIENIENLEEAIAGVMDARVILTTDTYFSHLAGATGKPTYTIFIKTNGVIWRPDNQPLSHALQSQLPLECVDMKVDGTCREFYGTCNKCYGQDLDFEWIGKTVSEELRKS